MCRNLNSAEIKTLQKNVIVSGIPQKLSIHIVATTLTFNDANPDTITDSGNGLVNAGFQAGDIIKVTGSVNNDGVYQIDTVAAGTITLISGEKLTPEVAGATVTVFKIFSKQVQDEVGYPIPDGWKVVIKAKKANTGDITIGGTSADALKTSNKFLRLDSNESVELNVANLKAVWIDATVNSDGIEIIHEK